MVSQHYWIKEFRLVVREYISSFYYQALDCTYHLKKKPIGFISFLRRRFGKIYIPYIFIISISALITLFIPIYKGSLFNYFGHVFFYKMFDRFAINSYGYQMWFISTIVQFYLVFHLLAWYIKRVNEKLFILTGLIISITWSLTVVALGNEDLETGIAFSFNFFGSL